MPDLPETEHAVHQRAGQRVRTVTRPDFTGTAGTPRAGLRRMHLFLSPSGREEQCGGPGFCVECEREAATMLTESPPCAAWTKGKSE